MMMPGVNRARRSDRRGRKPEREEQRDAGSQPRHAVLQAFNILLERWARGLTGDSA